MLGSEPTWAPEAHLDRVYRRGRQLRRRRRLLTIGGPTLVVVALVAAIGTVGAVNPGRGVRTVADPRAATSPVAPGYHGATNPGDFGNGGSAPDEGSGVGTESRATPAGPGATSTNKPGAGSPVTGSLRGEGGGGAVPSPGPGPAAATDPSANGGGDPSTASKTAPPAVGACSASDLDYATATDRTSYGAAQPVAISFIVHNHSSRPCDGPSVCGVGAWASVQSASGTEVWRSSPIAAMCTNPPPQPPRLNPGQSVGYPAGTWNQQICSSSGSCAAAAAGGYRAVGHRGASAGKPARFRLTS